MTKATTFHLLPAERGALEFFEGSHGFQENGEGLCQSQTDLKRHRKKIECLFFFPIHPHSLLQNLATHAKFPRQGSIIQSQLVECGKDVFNLIFHLNKLHCRVAIKETCCSAKCQTFILPILLYKLRAIMKCNTSCRSHVGNFYKKLSLMCDFSIQYLRWLAIPYNFGKSHI